MSNGASLSIFGSTSPARRGGPSAASRAAAQPPARRVLVAPQAASLAPGPTSELAESGPTNAAAALGRPVARPPLAPAIATRFVAILEAPLALGETVLAGFARKEAELRAVFEALTVIEAGALHKRLAINAPDDVLAAKFGRLTVDRRNRLLAFLADARRREAVSIARR